MVQAALPKAMVNWKAVHYVSYLAVLFFALEPSYIHPDEHFQSLEVLTSEFDARCPRPESLN